MANRTIYTREYSKSSAGRFVSAKGPKGDPLSDTALVEEFRNHANKWNRKPTALVSGSDRIVVTLTRAFEKYFGDDYRDGELAADIWIAFIEVPPTMDEDATRIHSAEELAEKCGDPECKKILSRVRFRVGYTRESVGFESITFYNRPLRKYDVIPRKNSNNKAPGKSASPKFVVVKVYDPKRELKLHRLSSSTPFTCGRCNKEKIAKLVAMYHNQWNDLRCNACYGKLLSED